MRKTILTAALLCAFLGTQAQEYYEKHVAFPAGATTEQKIDMAFPFGAYTATVGMATNGIHLFPSFWY